jgi:hypothetical protein
MIFGKHIHEIEENMTNLTDMVSFVEEAFALVQTLKSDGTMTKLIAAEQAVKAELAANPDVQKLETLIQAFLAKKAATTTTTTVTPSA